MKSKKQKEAVEAILKDAIAKLQNEESQVALKMAAMCSTLIGSMYSSGFDEIYDALCAFAERQLLAIKAKQN